MSKYHIISTYLEQKKKNKFLYLGDFASKLENYDKKKTFNNIKLNLENKKKLFIFNKKIIKILYEEYKKFYKSQISLKSFYIIVSPFIFTFLDIIRYKYKIINNCKKKIKIIYFLLCIKKILTK